MEADIDRALAKHTELLDLVERTLIDHTETPTSEARDIGSAIVAELCDIVPPEQPPLTFGVVKMASGGAGGAKTVKPGNVSLDLMRFFSLVASGGLAMTSAMAKPWTAPLVALVLCQSIRAASEAAIDERAACVLWTMWLSRDSNQRVDVPDLLARVNAERLEYGRAALSIAELDDSLAALQRLQCIRRADTEGAWLMVERVITKF